eukprot:124897-Prymnesium_polylepis.1
MPLFQARAWRGRPRPATCGAAAGEGPGALGTPGENECVSVTGVTRTLIRHSSPPPRVPRGINTQC